MKKLESKIHGKEIRMAIEFSAHAGSIPLTSDATVVASVAPIEFPTSGSQDKYKSVSQTPVVHPIWAPGAYARLMRSQNKNVVRELTEEARSDASITDGMIKQVSTSDPTKTSFVHSVDCSSSVVERNFMSSDRFYATQESNDIAPASLPTRASRRAITSGKPHAY